MTLFQSADRQPLNFNHNFNPSIIEPLHDDPVPFEQDTFASYSANPEEILMAKEALLFGMSDDYCDYFAEELNDESDCYFDGIAPTVNNLIKESK